MVRDEQIRASEICARACLVINVILNLKKKIQCLSKIAYYRIVNGIQKLLNNWFNNIINLLKLYLGIFLNFTSYKYVYV